MSVRTAVLPSANRTVLHTITGEPLPADQWTPAFWNNAWKALERRGDIQRCKAADEIMDPHDPPEGWDDLSGYEMPPAHQVVVEEPEQGEPDETLDFSGMRDDGPRGHDPATGLPIKIELPQGNEGDQESEDPPSGDEQSASESEGEPDGEESEPERRRPHSPTTPSGLHPDAEERIQGAIASLLEREAFNPDGRAQLSDKQRAFVTGVTQRMTIEDAVAHAQYAAHGEGQVASLLGSDRVVSAIHAALENGK